MENKIEKTITVRNVRGTSDKYRIVNASNFSITIGKVIDSTAIENLRRIGVRTIVESGSAF